MGIQARIRRIGKIGRILCTILLVFCVLITVLFLFGLATGSVSLNSSFQITKGPWSYSAGKPVTILFAAAWMVINAFAPLWLMRRLFVQFTRDEIFTHHTARLIKWLGVWNILQALGFGPTLLASGLFLLALGWGMELAASLKQEQDLTV